MSDVDKKVKGLIEKINDELSSLGSETRVVLGVFTTEDTGEKYVSVEVKMGRASYLAYSSPNSVGVKTFLQGMLTTIQLVSGNYRLKPMTELSRRLVPTSIIPAMHRKELREIPKPDLAKRKIDASVHPRFELIRNKYR